MARAEQSACREVDRAGYLRDHDALWSASRPCRGAGFLGWGGQAGMLRSVQEATEGGALMAYRTVRIRSMTQGQSKLGDPYLKVFLEGVGFAFCWHRDLWPVIQAAFDAKEEITLDLCNSETTSRGGTPFLQIEGYEHPGQAQMFEPDPEEARLDDGE